MRISIDLTLKEKIGIIGDLYAPQLDLKDRMGWTGYLDFLEPSDLTHSIMIGKDMYGRHFIAIKCVIDKIEDVLVVFQRYTNCLSTWVNCGFFDDRYMKEAYRPIVRDLLNGQCSYEGKQIYLSKHYYTPSYKYTSYKDIHIVCK